jgi:hypothetical protein
MVLPRRVLAAKPTVKQHLDAVRMRCGTVERLTVRLIAFLVCAFAGIGAVVAMRGDDYFVNVKHCWIRLHEKATEPHGGTRFSSNATLPDVPRTGRWGGIEGKEDGKRRDAGASIGKPRE